MKATITISDNPDGRTCEVQINFDPPAKQEVAAEDIRINGSGLL